MRPTCTIAAENARQALEDYARRRDEQAGCTAIVVELAPLIEAAKAAGMSDDAIAAILETAHERIMRVARGLDVPPDALLEGLTDSGEA